MTIEAISGVIRAATGLEAVVHGVVVIGAAVTDCNERFCAIIGSRRAEVLEKDFLELCPEVQADGAFSRERWQRRSQAALAGYPQWLPWQFSDRGGRAIHTLVHLAPTGQGVVTVDVHDLSHLRYAKWARPESVTRLEDVLDHTKAVIFVKDLEGRYMFANRELERAVRIPAEAIIGRTDRDIWPPELADRFRADDAQVLRERAATEFEVVGTVGGERKTFGSFKFPLFGPDGEPYAVCGIATDITERRRTQDALAKAALAVSSAQGTTVFQELVRYLATILEADAAMIATPLDGECAGGMRVHALFLDGEVRENFDYPLAGTPCETVVGQSFRIFPSGLRERFPADADLQRMDLDSYAGFPLSDGSGAPVGLISVMSRRPMTNGQFIESILKIFAVRAAAELQRQSAEDALRISEASYRELFDAGEDAVFVHDWETGAVVDVNPRACEIYGCSREEMKRISIADMGSGEHPYTADEAAKLIAKAKSGQPVRFEWHRRNRDGSLHWDHVVLKSAVIAGRRRILAFTREITELKLREQALKSSEEQYRAIFNVSSDGLLLRDAAFRVVDVNPAFLAITGYAREEVIGAQRVLTMPVEEPERAREMQRRAFGGESVHLEGKGARKDGTTYDCEIHLLPMRYRGEPHVLGILRDITARKQAEARRFELESQLRQAQKMEAIGHLTGGIAHDFNNLLTSIMGYIVLAADQPEAASPARVTKYLEQAQLSCARARDLIRQMLTFSRGQRGEPRPVSLPSLVEQSVKLFGSSFPSTIEIRTELGEEVPAVMLDPVHLDQVLLNLCLNAKDAMSGVGTIRVGVAAAPGNGRQCTACRQSAHGECVELSVADDGPGIAPAVMDRMFEPFFTTKEVGKGSGMGLASVHGIVHEFGGHIVVDTVPGRGTCFRALLPVLAAGGGVAAAGGAERARAPLARLSGHVLVVDDERAVAGFMRDLLESWGLAVTVAHAAAEASALFAGNPRAVDLVITDQAMPRTTGIELARELIALRPDLPVVLYTGFNEGLTRGEADAAGLRGVLTKPVDPHQLYGLLQTWLPPAATAAPH